MFPIFKNGSKSDPSNYRPISILPAISKIFEKHVNKCLMGYLNKYNLIHNCQSGFRQKNSCQTAVVKLIDQWMACIDNGDTVGTLFIDFRKAFDMVDHNTLLIQKHSLYKQTNTTLDWFTSYSKLSAPNNGQWPKSVKLLSIAIKCPSRLYIVTYLTLIIHLWLNSLHESLFNRHTRWWYHFSY